MAPYYRNILLGITLFTACTSAATATPKKAAIGRNASSVTTITTTAKAEKSRSSRNGIAVSSKMPPAGGAAAIVSEKRVLTSADLALAGALATMIGDAALHPIDCIKTLQQSNEGIGLSMIGAGKKIFADNGIPGFFNGLGCYVVSDGGAGAIKFATYEALKKWINGKVPEEYVGTAIFGCAALAFVASSVVLVPGELIKQRIQMGQVSSIADGISTIWKNEGILGFFTGYSGVCARDIPYTMLELGLYDNFKALYLKLKNRDLKEGEDEKPINQVDEIVAAAITGGITGYLTNPLDLIKTKLMVDTGMYTGYFNCLQQTVSNYGLSSLFQGGAARVAWLMPFTAIYLPIYELIKRRLEERPAPKGSIVSKNAIKVKGGAQRQRHRRYSLDGKDGRTFVSF